MRLRLPLATACLLAALLAAGCGAESNATPAACLDGPAAYLAALRDAPAAVMLREGTPISSCLVAAQKGGALGQVGEAMVLAATRLNAEARRNPGGAANVELGYLLGAAQRGAEGTNGIHADLIRRLAVAARYSPGRRPLPAAFTRAYRRGYDAGHSGG